jgi:hypothetical protein
MPARASLQVQAFGIVSHPLHGDGPVGRDDGLLHSAPRSVSGTLPPAASRSPRIDVLAWRDLNHSRDQVASNVSAATWARKSRAAASASADAPCPLTMNSARALASTKRSRSTSASSSAHPLDATMRRMRPDCLARPSLMCRLWLG